MDSYDSVHNIILLSAFTYIFLASLGFTLSSVIVALVVLSMLTCFSQLPFIIGQSLLRKYILSGYGSYARGLIEEELKKDEYVPLIRKPDFLVALFTVGFGSGLLYLASNIIQELFK